MNKFFQQFLKLKTYVIILTAVLILTNGFYFFVSFTVKYKKKFYGFLEPGAQYATLRDSLKDVREAGFITDQNTSAEKNEGEFQQAQYMLAPTVLVLNDTHFRYNVLDIREPKLIAYTLRRLKSIPIKDNEYGKVVIQRKLF